MLVDFTFNNKFQKIFGIGLSTSLIFHKKIGLNINKNFLKLKSRHLNKITKLKNSFDLEKNLKNKNKNLNQFLLKIRTTNSIRKSFSNKLHKKTNVKSKIKKK